MDTYRYRIDHDLGFAPNPFFNWCTLACCLSPLRRSAQKGDIVVGMAGKTGLPGIYPALIYWMQVEDALSFDSYWEDERFTPKKPQIGSCKMWAVGDNTYRRDHETGEWIFEPSMHHIPGHTQNSEAHVNKDTCVDRVLIGSRFTYWGASGPALPEELKPLFRPPRGYRRYYEDSGLMADLHALIEIDNPRGLVGDPADWDNPKYFAKV